MSPDMLPFNLTTFAAVLVFIVLLGLLPNLIRRYAAQDSSSHLGSLAQLLLGLGALTLTTYVVLYFLSLIGGFYESLTCKVVTIPSCEDPLGLPAWLRLPAQSVGGVMGVLPLVAVFLAKVLQPTTPPLPDVSDRPLWEGLTRRSLVWLGNNMGLIFILGLELWLAWLRGAAEASDRQLRLQLGLDSELPQAYLSVAQWGAVVLALGLSAVVIYLGIVGRHSRILLVRALGDLRYGAGLMNLLSALFRALAAALIALWTMTAITLGRLLLKTQSAIFRLWAMSMIAFGRLLLKLQSVLYSAWAFLATTVGWTLVWLSRIGRRGRGRTLEVLAFTLILGGWGVSYAATYVVLIDATGSEAERIQETNGTVLAWADPSPQRALLERGDRLVVIPIRAPGNLDATYSALFNATYPSSQLERYDFFITLRDALPTEVDTDFGTGLSEALRAAAFYLREAEGEKVLVVFGNGEDHSPEAVQPADLPLENTTVVHLNLGLEERERWQDLYQQAGAADTLLYDLAATRSLRQVELREDLSTSE